MLPLLASFSSKNYPQNFRKHQEETEREEEEEETVAHT